MKRKYERHFSITDLFLLLLLALVAVSTFLRWSGLQKVTAKVTEAQDLVLYSGATLPAVADCFLEDEILYAADGTRFGRVLSVEKIPLSETLLSNGQLYQGEWDPAYRCRLRLTVECEIALSDGLLLVNGLTPLSVGETLVLRGAYAELEFQLYEMTDFSA